MSLREARSKIRRRTENITHKVAAVAVAAVLLAVRLQSIVIDSAMHVRDDEQTAPWLRLQSAAYTLALSSLNYSTLPYLVFTHSETLHYGQSFCNGFSPSH